MSAKPPVSDLKDHLGYCLRLVSNHVSTAFARKVEGEGVTVAEWVVLRVLFDAADLAPSKLAAILGMTRGAISKLADRLLEKGLIVRTDCPDDARAHTLALSKKGKRLVPRLAALADENDRLFFAILEPDERTALRRILDMLAERHGFGAVPID